MTHKPGEHRSPSALLPSTTEWYLWRTLTQVAIVDHRFIEQDVTYGNEVGLLTIARSKKEMLIP
jgi:hypothetical protein